MSYARRTVLAAGAPLTVALALLVSSCTSTTTTTTSTSPAPGSTAPGPTPGTGPGAAGPGLSSGSTITAADKQAVVDTYADGVYASYDASVASAVELRAKLEAFTGGPSQAGLDAAKQQWLDARDDYGVTEAFRFYDGPIDAPDTGPEGQINAWPMDEAYVDYVEGDPTAGVINDAAGFPTITTEVLVAANEEGGEENISTGWHAIEFLLWGQDTNADGPGTRPFTDYTSAPNADRRITYVTLLVDLLVTDLTTVRDAWKADGADNYRASFVKDPDAALASIFRGMGALTKGELAGERMAVAYETKDQEDEHSCFSDNTANDVKNNALGIQRVYLAQFPGATGPSPSDLVAKVSPEVDATVTKELAESVKLASNFPTTFEKMIQGDDAAAGRMAMLTAIEALEQQGDSIAEAAKVIGLDVNFEIA